MTPPGRATPATSPATPTAPNAARLVAIATVAGAVLRLALLARQPIGFDEDFTAVTVHQPLDRMLSIVSHDSAPPLFYLLERAVVAVFDALGLATFGGPGGPVALRLLPAIAGIALIPLLAALATRMAGPAAGAATAALVAFAPPTVWLSGFARMAGPAGTLAVAAALLLLRATDGRDEPPTGRRPRTRDAAWRWLPYVAVAAAALWTDYFAAFALAAVTLAVAWHRRRLDAARKSIAATAAAGLTLVPWLVVASAQLRHSSQGFWVEPLGPRELAGTAGQLLAGPAIASDVTGFPLILALQAATIGVWVVALAWLAVRWRGLDTPARRGLTFGLVASSGVVMLAAVSVVRPLFDARYLDVMWLPIFGLAGAGLGLMPRRVASLAVAVVAVAGLAVSIPITHAQVRDVIPELDASVGPHDLVATTPDQYLILLDESGPRVLDRLQVLATDDPSWFSGTAAYPDGAVVHAVPNDVLEHDGRIFWVAAPGVTTPLLPPGYRPTESRCVLLACLTIYER